MTATTIDPRTALVVIDLQRGIVALPTAHPAREIVARAAKLAAAFRERGLPVVLVNVAGGPPGRNEGPAMSGSLPADWTELVDELDVQDGDIRITKLQWGAFHGTALDLELRRRGVTQIVLAGISTSIGVESTARAAHEHGYHVTVAADAVTDTDAESHAHAFAKIFPRLAETAGTDEIIALLPAVPAA
ncbi:isochorismatase family protein [Streptomyces sp. NPDC008317]|uniref:isochorismatase family protein n=1 Tax=unclassified Streptomyces TaxID=2593676 RepID=UPI0036E2293D